MTCGFIRSFANRFVTFGTNLPRNNISIQVCYCTEFPRKTFRSSPTADTVGKVDYFESTWVIKGVADGFLASLEASLLATWVWPRILAAAILELIMNFVSFIAPKALRDLLICSSGDYSLDFSDEKEDDWSKKQNLSTEKSNYWHIKSRYSHSRWQEVLLGGNMLVLSYWAFWTFYFAASGCVA